MDKLNFENLDLYFDGDIRINNDTVEIVDEEGKDCIRFIIFDEDEIWLDELKRCSNSGTKNIELLTTYASSNGFKRISLKDQSSIFINPFRLDMAALYILSEGQSWYNKLGFKQADYYFEMDQWNELREKRFIDVTEDITSLTYEDLKTKDWYNSPFFILFGEEPTRENYNIMLVNLVNEIEQKLGRIRTLKIGEIAGVIHSMIKRKKVIKPDDYFFLAYIAMISYIIPYDRSKLSLRINSLKRKIEE